MSAKQTAESFWAKVDIRSESECWPWLGVTNIWGYGQLSWGGTRTKAHRVAAYLHNIVPTIAAPVDRTASGFALHSCDNRLCCNPNHLRSGTFKENARDRDERGRAADASGENCGTAKLKWAQVAEIRQRYAAGGASLRELAVEFLVDHSTIHLIVKNKNWKDPTSSMVN